MSTNPPRRTRATYYEGVPDYMTEVYDWAYVNPVKAGLLDRNIVVSTLLFMNDQRLMRRYLERIRPGSRVWQVAHVYGDLVQRAADKVGPDGHFTLTDITPVQIEHSLNKLADRPQAEVIRADASTWQGDAPFDLVCSFFLLHEVPEALKAAIVDNMLNQVAEDGELVFVDYHGPQVWQPIGWLLKYVNRWLEPFAEALWHKEISAYATRKDEFMWEKETIFGGVYQIVRVKRR